MLSYIKNVVVVMLLIAWLETPAFLPNHCLAKFEPNTPVTRGVTGSRDRMLAVKRRKITQNQLFFMKNKDYKKIGYIF